MPLIPCFYHPTTLVLVDDHADFLHNLKLTLLPYYHCQLFIAPSAAQQFLLQQHTHYQQEVQRCLTVSQDSMAELAIDITLSPIYQQVFNAQRFAHACIVILDYDMPELDGLAVARQLKATTDTQIILLTGEADQDTAIDAFNHQEIDRFVSKSAPDYLLQLQRYIMQLQQNYFIAYSAGILESLKAQENHPLFDSEFVALFYMLCKKHRIVEYYFADEFGSFLMLNAAGKAIWLVVRSEAAMQTFYELSSDSEEGHALAQSLKSRQKIVFFRQSNYHLTDIKEWVIKDAIVLKERQIYYGLFQESEGYRLDTHKLRSYQQFLNSF